jgi:hypothetical protein
MTKSGGFHVCESHLDIDTLIRSSCDVMVARKIMIPGGRSWTFESRVSMLLQAFDSFETTQPWVLVVDGELRIATAADVIFTQGKVFISTSGTLILEGIAAFEALSLGRDYYSNGSMQQPSTRTCVTGSGTFNTRLILAARHEATARFEIYCIFAPNIHFSFKESTYLIGSVQPGELEPPEQSKFLSVELTLLVGLQSFAANFDSKTTNNVGFRVAIHNINDNTTLDLQIKKLDATNLNLVGQIRVSCDNCYVYRLQISGTGTGVALMEGGIDFHLK